MKIEIILLTIMTVFLALTAVFVWIKNIPQMYWVVCLMIFMVATALFCSKVAYADEAVQRGNAPIKNDVVKNEVYYLVIGKDSVYIFRGDHKLSSMLRDPLIFTK